MKFLMLTRTQIRGGPKQICVNAKYIISYYESSEVCLLDLETPMTVKQHPRDIRRALEALGEAPDGTTLLPVISDETRREMGMGEDAQSAAADVVRAVKV